MTLYEPFQFLNPIECDQIIEYAKQYPFKKGTTGNKSFKGRNNRIVWYEDSQRWKEWIEMFNKIEPVIDWIQTPQVAFYGPGEKYDWHVDTWPNYRTHIRHFTLTCELQSAPDAKLELENKNIELQKGQAVIFKPQDRHRAVSPTEGERISFTIWAMALNLTKH